MLLKVSSDALTQTQAMHERLLLEVSTENFCLVFKLSSFEAKIFWEVVLLSIEKEEEKSQGKGSFQMYQT